LNPRHDNWVYNATTVIIGTKAIVASFQGLPKPNAVDLAADANSDFSDRDYLVASLEEIQNNFRRFGLLDHQVKFLKGWFSETLPDAPIERLAIMRLDGDLYESTMDALNGLYHRLSPGGYVIIDDYYSWKGCKQAVQEFRDKNKIADVIQDIDAHGCFWRRSV
jgi:O-methyltransferase